MADENANFRLILKKKNGKKMKLTWANYSSPFMSNNMKLNFVYITLYFVVLFLSDLWLFSKCIDFAERWRSKHPANLRASSQVYHFIQPQYFDYNLVKHVSLSLWKSCFFFFFF
jgi:hypothetical protein